VLVRRLYDEDPKTFLAYGFSKPVETHSLVQFETEHAVDPELLAAARIIARERRERLELENSGNGNGH